MTVAEFRELPEDSGPVYHELRHGEPVAMTRAKLKHFKIQRNLRALLAPFAEPGSCVELEVAFRPLPENELWVADVAYVSAERFHAADDEDYLRGAPELVIEVLSPSNTAEEMNDCEHICLANGAREFWVVDSKRRQIKVSTPDGHTVTFRENDEIAVPFASGARLKVADVLRY